MTEECYDLYEIEQIIKQNGLIISKEKIGSGPFPPNGNYVHYEFISFYGQKYISAFFFLQKYETRATIKVEYEFLQCYIPSYHEKLSPSKCAYLQELKQSQYRNKFVTEIKLFYNSFYYMLKQNAVPLNVMRYYHNLTIQNLME